MADHQVLVLGAGSWGTALALQLAVKTENQIWLWSHRADHCQQMQQDNENRRFLPDCPFPANLQVCESWQSALSQVQTVLVAVPSSAFPAMLAELGRSITTQGIIWATKGFCHETCRFLHEIADQHLPDSTPRAILTGPSFAKEVARQLPTAVVVASPDETFAAAMQDLFSTRSFRVYRSHDMIGVQVGGALKNALAIATGISDGLGFGANARVGLITRGMVELEKLGTTLGARRDTLMGLSGLGDLVLTCTDDQSRNRQFGLKLGGGDTPESAARAVGQVVEGVPATRSIKVLAGHYHIELPIVEQIYQVLFAELPPLEAVTNLMSRRPKAERSV